jgi:hypothetical protein
VPVRTGSTAAGVSEQAAPAMGVWICSIWRRAAGSYTRVTFACCWSMHMTRRSVHP